MPSKRFMAEFEVLHHENSSPASAQERLWRALQYLNNIDNPGMFVTRMWSEEVLPFAEESERNGMRAGAKKVMLRFRRAAVQEAVNHDRARSKVFSGHEGWADLARAERLEARAFSAFGAAWAMMAELLGMEVAEEITQEVAEEITQEVKAEIPEPIDIPVAK